MDKLYIGDIPEEYHYAVFSQNYVDLYNSSNPSGRVLRYRVFLNDKNFFYYSEDYVNITYSVSVKDIDVSQDFVYRSDFSDIAVSSFIIIFSIILLFNIVTSCFKKGGVFSGLI